MIKINNLSYSIKDKNILSNVSLNIEKGKFYTMIGPNGCGKSSIIRAISNQIDYTGQITIFNQDRKVIKQSEFAKKVAIMMQFNSTVSHICVEEMIYYGRYPFKSIFGRTNSDDKDIVDNCLEMTDLTKIKNQMIDTLSGGEKQRVFLAMCLAQQPEILILDEPTNHLDIKYQFELLNVVRKINQNNGLTVLCVLHDINQALKYSDYIYIMEKGKIVKEGTPIDTVSEVLIKDVFEVDSIIHRDNNGLHVDYIV